MKAGDWQRRLSEWQQSGVFADLLPEVAALRDVRQPPAYHAEGDALVHTLLAVAAVDAQADERVFWAVLLHDIGKAQTTELYEGRWRAHGHVEQGAKMVAPVLRRLNLDKLVDDVTWLVGHHHFVLDWGPAAEKGLTTRQQRFCRHPLFALLVQVCRADAAASYGGSNKGQRLEKILVRLLPEQRF
jgi:putative nucleotidyltransferase with HDIG domain